MSEIDKKLSLTESSDFYLLLELMLPLYKEEEFAWLPELFSIVGHEKLLLLCRYAGGSTIKIPRLDEITKAIEALDWYYKVYLKKCKYKKSIPAELRELVDTIQEVMNARDS